MEALLAHARELHEQGDLAAAEAAYRQILAQHPHHPDATHFLGVLARQTNRPAEGLDLLRRSIQLAPGRALFHFHLGYALDEDGRLDEAATAYRQAIALAPANPLPLTNLGLLLQAQEKIDEATDLLERAVALSPTQDAHFNLARAYEDASRFLEAVPELERAVALDRSCAALTRAAAALRRMDQLSPAIDLSQEAADRFPHDLSALLALARALDDADRKSDALAAYRRVLEHQPDDAEAAFFIQCASGPPPAAPPAKFVRDLYDGIADSFDHHLEKKLGYDGPRQMAQLLANILQKPDLGIAPPFDILDAGCGTGLAAPFLKPLARSLVGIDLSPKMIRKAQDRGLYTQLHVGNIAEVMCQYPQAIDLVLALEVLVYLGDLQAVFQSAAAALRSRGLFALSVEAHEGPGYILQPAKRYAHCRAYLAQLAHSAGFTELTCQTSTLRLERGKPVPCFLLIFQRA